MTKLYATMRSERPSREARKGGDERIKIELTNKGRPEYEVTYTQEGLTVVGDDGILLETGKEQQVKA